MEGGQSKRLAPFHVRRAKGFKATVRSATFLGMRNGFLPVRLLAVGGLVVATGCATSGLDRLPSLGVAEPAGSVQVLQLKIESHYFEPSRLMVKVGVPVRLVLENGTLMAGHDFSIFSPAAGLDMNSYIPARQQVTVQFLPGKIGEYEFYCNIDDHAGKGGRGTLVVVDELPGRGSSRPRP